MPEWKRLHNGWHLHLGLLGDICNITVAFYTLYVFLTNISNVYDRLKSFSQAKGHYKFVIN